ncbi:MAG: ATP-dependent zinc protease [Alphaproteobacteria bacterium]
MDNWRFGAMAIAVLMAASAASPSLADSSPRVAGWIENAWLINPGMSFEAKLDTGARTSSVHAPGAEIYRKGGKRFVKFTLASPSGRSMQLDLPLVRISMTRDMNGPTIKRPVVMLRMCAAGVIGETEVNLSNRPGFNYALLIGRTFMVNRIIVDSAREKLHPAACAGDTK